MQLEIEREALRKESDKASRERLERSSKELADLKEARTGLAAQWQQEKARFRRARAEGRTRAAAQEIERAQRAGDFAQASELQYGRIPELERRSASTNRLRSDAGMLKEQVDEEDIAGVVSRWTRIPSAV
jgi:ATP-dependent Clp protease ATP-binding subunit ClpB